MLRREKESQRWRIEFDRAQKRLAELDEKGAAALSSYDINIAFGGDAQRALDVSRQLVSNHVAYFGGKVRSLGPEVTQLGMFAPQADIFVAPEPTEDEYLESDYNESQGEKWDFNEIEQGMWDDDPSPYDGTHTEE